MKLRFIGFLLIALGVLFAPVSFASDGPPTEKVAFDNFDHPVSIAVEITADYDFAFTSDYSGPELVNDVGKEVKDYKYKYAALHSTFVWEVYNSWLPTDYFLKDDHKQTNLNYSYSEPILANKKFRTKYNC
jgi:hypothetical protein